MAGVRAVQQQLCALVLALGAVPSGALARSADPIVTEHQIAAADAMADFDALYAGLKDAQSGLDANIPAAALEAAYRSDRATLDRPMSLLELQTVFQRFVARIGIAHTRIAFPAAPYDRFLQGGGTVFPLDVRIDAGRVWVIANHSGLATPAIGDEILAVNGLRTTPWLARLARNVSADTRYLGHSILEFRLPGYLWLEFGPSSTFELTIRSSKGAIRRVRLPAATAADLRRFGKAPSANADQSNARVARMLPGAIAYLHPGPFYNYAVGANAWDNRAFVAFIDDAFQTFIAADAKSLVIDLRDNPGGDASFSDPMIAWFATRSFRFVSDFRIRISRQTIASNQTRLDAAAAAGVTDPASSKLARFYAAAPLGSTRSFKIPLVPPQDCRRFTGNVYLLINRYSYSNTVNVAAIVQDYRFGTILGEETTDLATTYGAMESFALPRTGISVGYAKALLIRPNGSLERRGVVPDVAIRVPVAARGDVMLQRALAVVRSRDQSRVTGRPRDRLDRTRTSAPFQAYKGAAPSSDTRR